MARHTKSSLFSLYAVFCACVHGQFTEEAEPAGSPPNDYSSKGEVVQRRCAMQLAVTRDTDPVLVDPKREFLINGSGEGLDTPCITVMNVNNPARDSIDNGAAENAMNTLLYKVTRPEHYIEEEPPSLGEYTSPSSIFTALQEPSGNFTVLMPPASQLQFVPVALEHNLITHSDALRLALLHIVPGRYLTADLMAAMNEGRQLLTINGELLDVVQGPSLSDIDLMYGANSVTLDVLDRKSCKPGSTVHYINALIWDSSLEDLQVKYNENTVDQSLDESADEELGETKSKRISTGLMILLIVTAIVCTPFCCFLWKRWSQSVSKTKGDDDDDEEFEAFAAQLKERRSTHDKILPFGRWLNGVATQQNPAAPPKVLYRMDGNLWSTMPPCSPSPNSSSLKAMKVHDNHAYDDMMRVQSEGLKHYEGNSRDFAAPTSNACSRCMEQEGDHVLLPCGHGGFCGTCAQEIFKPPEKRSPENSGRSIGGDSAACGQCPVCCAPLTAVVQVPVDTPVGSSGNILQVSAGGFGESAGLLSFDRSHSARSEPPALDLMGPKYSVNPIAELSTSQVIELSDHLEKQTKRAPNPVISSGPPQKNLVPLQQEIINGLRKDESSMEGVASFMVWEEQASEAGTSFSRTSHQLREEGDSPYTVATAPAESNPIEFW